MLAQSGHSNYAATPPYKHDKVTWDPSISSRIISSLHHLGAPMKKRECVGQGYGFTEPTQESFSVNKMVGAACWFSTLKARTGLPDTILATLPDAEPAAAAFGFEKRTGALQRPSHRPGGSPFPTKPATTPSSSLFNGVSRDLPHLSPCSSATASAQ